ncbi:MAG TPA: PEP-CTERM sorting domain-containing protein [Fimbriimonadaceae bacterium]|nr:PEP-CTERM sorting domain-containing protein [Fimbriimonadaceae bacterium]HRJ33994.1 PEP-CTERM sorting domain-containing protein [Fimbriimonadaceae bacterium]
MKSLKSMITLGMVACVSLAFADLQSEFSISNGNPNGVWTYGTLSSIGGTFTAFTTPQTFNPGPWSGSAWAPGVNSLPAAFRLDSGSLNGWNGGVGGVLVGEVTLHGGPSGELAVVRWTPTTGGVFNLSGFFKSGDGLGSTFGRIDAYVARGNSVLWSMLDTDITHNFALSNVAVSTGESIDVIVGIGQDTFNYDTTPVNLVVTPVPEPATMAALGLGVTAVLRRRRARS